MHEPINLKQLFDENFDHKLYLNIPVYLLIESLIKDTTKGLCSKCSGFYFLEKKNTYTAFYFLLSCKKNCYPIIVLKNITQSLPFDIYLLPSKSILI